MINDKTQSGAAVKAVVEHSYNIARSAFYRRYQEIKREGNIIEGEYRVINEILELSNDNK